jgi:hypothetical protein
LEALVVVEDRLLGDKCDSGAGVDTSEQREQHTARVRIVLMASSSVLEYGMMGRFLREWSYGGEKSLRRAGLVL